MGGSLWSMTEVAGHLKTGRGGEAGTHAFQSLFYAIHLLAFISEMMSISVCLHVQVREEYRNWFKKMGKRTETDNYDLFGSVTHTKMVRFHLLSFHAFPYV